MAADSESGTSAKQGNEGKADIQSKEYQDKLKYPGDLPYREEPKYYPDGSRQQRTVEQQKKQDELVKFNRRQNGLPLSLPTSIPITDQPQNSTRTAPVPHPAAPAASASKRTSATASTCTPTHSRRSRKPTPTTR